MIVPEARKAQPVYDALYGSLGGVIVLMLWLFAAGWGILFGAELNDVLRRREPRP